MLDKIKKIISILILIILLPILFVNGVILIDSFLHPNEIPSFFGWKPFIVLSGSMENEIYSGDLAIVKEVDTEIIKENDIIAFEKENLVTTHRVVEIIKENGITKYKTKGDQNNIEDNGFVFPEQVEGLYQFKISKLGNLLMFTQTPIGMVICLSIPIALLIIMQKIGNIKETKIKSQKEEELEKEIERLKRQNEKLMKNNS